LQRQSGWYLPISGSSNLKQESKQPPVTINPDDDDDDDDDDSDDMIGPMPAEKDERNEAEESEEEYDDDEFPVSHEMILKDHTKVDFIRTSL
jgi:WD repeat-containing protein 70